MLSKIALSLGLATITILAGEGGDRLAENLHMDLKTVAAIVTFSGGIVWWLSARFQFLADEIKSIKGSIRSLPCQLTKSNTCLSGEEKKGD